MAIVKKYEDLVWQIVCRLVTKPEAVTVESVTVDNRHTIRVHVDHSDFGQVIGKQGRTAQAIRAILMAAAIRDKTRVGLDIG